MSLVRRRPVSVTALETQLRPGEALVEYVMDEKGSYAIEISRAGIKVHNLVARAEISALSRSFVTAIRNGTDSQPSGRELYKQLIAPAILFPSPPL